MAKATRRLCIVGASGHAKVVADIAWQTGWDIVAFAESHPREDGFCERPVVALAQLGQRVGDLSAIVAIGNPVARNRAARQLRDAGIPLATLVHPAAAVAPDVALGEGTVVMACAAINPGSTVGECVIVNTGAVVDHDCTLGSFVHVCPGATLAGTVAVGDGTWIGVGATVTNNVRVGRWVMVGAGALVLRDVPDEVVVVGSPARVLREGRHFA